MDFVYVADITEISVGTMKLVIIDDREVLIVNVQRKYYALSNKCPHAGGSLSEGKLDNNIITCLKHGAEIDVTTGKIVVGEDDDEDEEKEIRLLNFKGKDERIYKIKIEERNIFVGY
jgi:nitrite reductase/ring-hydroxylating ferredoxin subunit